MDNTKKVILAMLFSITIAACGSDDLNDRSSEEIVAEFNAAVLGSNDCATDDECVLVHTECPLGCASAVNVDEEETIMNLASALKEEYASGSVDCSYGCVQSMAVCVIDKCETQSLF